MGGGETLQSWHQPLGRERGRHPHVQRVLPRLAAHPPHAFAELAEPLAQRRQAGFGGRGQRQPPCEPVEQLNAELVLERTNLLTDRRRRHVQLVGGAAEAQVPRGGLEGDQGVEGQGAEHGGFSTDSQAIAVDNETSFVAVRPCTQTR